MSKFQISESEAKPYRQTSRDMFRSSANWMAGITIKSEDDRLNYNAVFGELYNYELKFTV